MKTDLDASDLIERLRRRHKGDACLWFLPNLRTAWNDHIREIASLTIGRDRLLLDAKASAEEREALKGKIAEAKEVMLDQSLSGAMLRTERNSLLARVAGLEDAARGVLEWWRNEWDCLETPGHHGDDKALGALRAALSPAPADETEREKRL